VTKAIFGGTNRRRPEASSSRDSSGELDSPGGDLGADLPSLEEAVRQLEIDQVRQLRRMREENFHLNRPDGRADPGQDDAGVMAKHTERLATISPSLLIPLVHLARSCRRTDRNLCYQKLHRVRFHYLR
jgi:hypothetical protein